MMDGTKYLNATNEQSVKNVAVCKKALLGVGLLILLSIIPSDLWSDVRVGMEGAMEKRENGDRVYLPQGWLDVSVSRFVSESLSLFGDFFAKGGWDTGEKEVPYDIGGSISGSLRGESFFIGLEGGLRGIRKYDTPRQLEAYLASKLSYNRVTSSLFLKPFVQTILGPTDSTTMALEPGIEKLFGESWMGAFSIRPSLTRYSDGSSEVSLEPNLTLDWYPSIPFTANLRGGWARQWLDNSDVMKESIFGSLDLIWYPTLHTILQLDTTLEKVYRSISPLDEGLIVDSEMELRVGLPSRSGSISKGLWELILGGGYEWWFSSEDLQTEDQWYVRIGLEMNL
ncbi:MAG: hypothetical protein Kow009_09610 [Spirochaetales bacterium]